MNYYVLPLYFIEHNASTPMIQFSLDIFFSFASAKPTIEKEFSVLKQRRHQLPKYFIFLIST